MVIKPLMSVITDGEWISNLVDMLTVSPKNYFANTTGSDVGSVYSVVELVNEVMCVFGYQILSILFLLEVITKAINFDNFNYKILAKVLIKFVLVKTVLDNSLLIMETFFDISSVMTRAIDNALASNTAENQAMTEALLREKLKDVSWVEEIFMAIGAYITMGVSWCTKWAIYLLVLGRVLTLYTYTALSPLPLSMLVSDHTSQGSKNFLLNFIATCLNSITMIFILVVYQKIVGNLYVSYDTNYSSSPVAKLIFGVVGGAAGSMSSSFWMQTFSQIIFYVVMTVFLFMMLKKANNTTNKLVGAN